MSNFRGQPENIPTLTEVLKSSSEPGDNKTSKTNSSQLRKRETESIASTTTPAIDRDQLVDLIYSKLHQDLPQICQNIADEIISEFNLEIQPDPLKSTKSKSRR